MRAPRRKLTFAAYDPAAKVTLGDLDTYVWSVTRWQLLMAALNYGPVQRGTPQERKKVAETRRKLRHVGAISGEPPVWNLRPEGGEVLLHQSELDCLRSAFAAVTSAGSQLSIDVDLSLDVDEFLAEVPEVEGAE